MSQTELRLFIRATPERVWSILSDIEGQPRWMEDLRRMSVTSAQKAGAGTRVVVTSELFGLPLLHDVMDVTV